MPEANDYPSTTIPLSAVGLLDITERRTVRAVYRAFKLAREWIVSFGL